VWGTTESLSADAIHPLTCYTGSVFWAGKMSREDFYEAFSG
jgi:hypothetical protein